MMSCHNTSNCAWRQVNLGQLQQLIGVVWLSIQSQPITKPVQPQENKFWLTASNWPPWRKDRLFAAGKDGKFCRSHYNFNTYILELTVPVLCQHICFRYIHSTGPTLASCKIPIYILREDCLAHWENIFKTQISQFCQRSLIASLNRSQRK